MTNVINLREKRLDHHASEIRTLIDKSIDNALEQGRALLAMKVIVDAADTAEAADARQLFSETCRSVHLTRQDARILMSCAKKSALSDVDRRAIQNLVLRQVERSIGKRTL